MDLWPFILALFFLGFNPYSIVEKILHFVGIESYNTFSHEKSIFLETKTDYDEQCIAVIIAEDMALTDRLVEQNFQEGHNFHDELYFYNAATDEHIRFHIHSTLVTNPQIVLITPEKNFASKRVIRIWDTVLDGPIGNGLAFTFVERHNLEWTNFRQPYHVTIDPNDPNIILLKDIKEYVPGMSLIRNSKLIGVFLSYNRETDIVKFAKITQQYVDQSRIRTGN